MSLLNISLHRDGPKVQWGFRLQGGYDIGQPLTIQRVFLGSPSDGVLQRSDVLLKIGLADCTQLSHEQATHLIKNSGTHINVTVSRSQSGPSSPGSSLPTTPISPGSHPLYGAAKPTMYARPLPKANITPPRQVQPPPSALKTEMAPTPANNWLASEAMAKNTLDAETNAIVNQTYRTNALVLPGAKARHDLPTGSYLRHTKDPDTRKAYNQSFLSQPAMNKISDALMLSKPGADSHVYKSQVQQSLMGKEAPSKAKFRESMSPASDGIVLSNKTKVVHRQYNTPINMYSTQAVGDTLAGQARFNLKNDQLPNAPFRVVDFTKSPTYMMLQEPKDKSKKMPVTIHEHTTVKNLVYPKTKVSTKPEFVNQMGTSKEKIHQSKSFHYILSDYQTDL